MKFNSKQSSTRDLHSKQNITSVQAPVLGKKILLVDKSDNHVLSHQPNYAMLQHDMGLLGKAKGMARTIVFPFRRRWKRIMLCDVLQCMTFYPCVLQVFMQVSKTKIGKSCHMRVET